MHPSPPSLPPPGGPPAGWYPDPSGVGERYFDGRQWIADTPPLVWPTAGAPHVAPASPYPTLPLSAAIGALVVLAISLVVQHVVARQLLDRDLPLLLRSAIGILLAYGPSLWWCRRVLRANPGSAADRLGWRARWSDLGWGPVTFLGSYVANVIVSLVAIQALGVPFESNVDTVEGDITAAFVISMIATAVIAAPIVEELVFRGVVMRGLASRLGLAGAVALQGVLFGLAHVDPIERGWGNIGLALGLTAVGCGLGLVTALTRRLGAAVLAHAILNGIVVTLLLTGVLDDLDRELGRFATLVLQLV